MSYDSYDDLDSFGGDWRPQQGIRLGIETLADADYDLTIVDAELSHAQNNDRILKIGLRTQAGQEVEWTHWLNKQQSANRLCADLCLLGFDADKWGAAAGRPLSVELPRAVAQMRGLRFRAAKRSRTGKDSKVYHDLHITSRLGGAPMPVTNHAAAPAAVGGDESIPF